MMRVFLVIMLAGIVTGLSGSAGARSCYSMPADKAGEIQQGRLVQKTIGGKRVYFLRIPVPVCLTARNSKGNARGTRIIKVYSSDAEVKRSIVRFVGKDVQVTGRAVGMVTRGHKASIVMDLSDIDQI
jgi:hypothetical protein